MRRRPRGFTLVELMVSLVAGVIIAIAVVGLSRTATKTFHEQVRIQTVESALRGASERLRNDLVRVSFMGTGNIKLARNDNPSVPFGQKISTTIGATTGARWNELKDLQGIHIKVGGSRPDNALTGTGSEGPNNLATNNGLNPDELWVSGNLTTDDSYRAQWLGNGACGGPQLVMRKLADPAVARLLANGSTPLAAVQAAFMPVAGKEFIARVVDPRGCQHYVKVCGVTASATQAAISLSSDAMDASGRPILTKADDGTTCGGEDQEEFTISPLHRVHWYIGPNTDPRLATDPNIEPTGNKFNLYRQLIAFDNSNAGAPEVVAEYAIDLKFGIAVDDPTQAAPNHMRVFDLDTDTGGGMIDQWTQNASATLPNNPGPQRVRSVRFRLAARAPIPDRTANLSLGLPAPDTYLVRYCIENSAPSSCKKFVRVRTIVSEVALINQAEMSY